MVGGRSGSCHDPKSVRRGVLQPKAHWPVTVIIAAPHTEEASTTTFA